MTKSEEALKYFSEGFSCSQAVLRAFADDFNFDGDQALKVAGSFGGGIARMNSLCGAVTGALMVIGLRYGKTDANDNQQKEINYKMAQEFVAKFKEKNSSIMCSELIGIDLSNPEAGAFMKQNNLTALVCQKAIKDAVEVLEELL